MSSVPTILATRVGQEDSASRFFADTVTGQPLMSPEELAIESINGTASTIVGVCAEGFGALPQIAVAGFAKLALDQAAGAIGVGDRGSSQFSEEELSEIYVEVYGGSL